MEVQYQDFGLLEGTCFHHRIDKMSQPLGQLNGYGARLVVRQPYNSDETDLTLAEQVVNRGLIRDVVFSHEEIRIRLTGECEIAPEHVILALNSRFEIHEWRPRGSDGQAWIVDNTGFGSIRMVAVFYSGRRVGGWVNVLPRDDPRMHWSTALRSVNDKELAYTAACCLRWFKAPILSHYHLPEVLSFVQTWPVEVICAWLREESIELQGYQLGALEVDEAWSCTLSEIFESPGLRLPVDVEQATRIIEDLYGAPIETAVFQEAITCAAERLLQISPKLMARVAVTWLLKSGVKDLAFIKCQLRELLQPDETQIEALRRRMGNVDSHFLEMLVKRASGDTAAGESRYTTNG